MATWGCSQGARIIRHGRCAHRAQKRAGRTRSPKRVRPASEASIRGALCVCTGCTLARASFGMRRHPRSFVLHSYNGRAKSVVPQSESGRRALTIGTSGVCAILHITVHGCVRARLRALLSGVWGKIEEGVNQSQQCEPPVDYAVIALQRLAYARRVLTLKVFSILYLDPEAHAVRP